MKKAYSGNGRPYILALFSEADSERVMPVLEELDGRGFALCGQDGKVSAGKAKRACAVIAFLSANFSADEARQAVFFAADAASVPIVPVNLDKSQPPELLQRALFAKNSLMAGRYSTVELADRICSAEALQSPSVTPAQKKAARTGMYALLAAAALVVAAGGLFLWRTLSANSTMEEPAVEAMVQVDPQVLESYGITETELSEIGSVVIIGEHFSYYTDDDLREYGVWPGEDFVATTVWEDVNTAHWYSKEDGHEFSLTRYDDLSFLAMMPNLRYLAIALVDAEEMPDLSGLPLLEGVAIHGCTFDELDWLTGATIRDFTAYLSRATDYSPLTSCENLQSVQIDLSQLQQADFSGFAPPRLEWLFLDNGQNLTALELSALSGSETLREVRLRALPLSDLSCLEGTERLEYLSVENMSQLRDISVLRDMSSLKELEIQYCPQVTDYTPIAGCAALERIQIQGDFNPDALTDASFLANLPKLTDVGLYSCNLRDMDFLEGLADNGTIRLGFAGDIQDYSGLAAIDHFNYLHVNPRDQFSERGGDFSAVLPYIQNAVIDNLMLYSCAGVDLSALPTVTNDLSIRYGDLTSLAGLKDAGIAMLELWDMQYLTSLDGLEALDHLHDGRLELDIVGCPRLADFSALDSAYLELLDLVGTYTVPDLSGFRMNVLHLESVDGLTDLSCLDTLDDSERYNIELVGLDAVTDLTPLWRLHGDKLTVPPQVEEQAAALVEEENFGEYSVEYPDGSWQPYEGTVTLLSLDELDTLPKSLLARVESLAVAGDTLFDPGQYDVWEQWEDGSDTPTPYLHDRESDELIPIEPGTLDDLSVLAPLTGLRELRLYDQPLVTLDGIQSLYALEFLEVSYCPALTDASAAFALDGLRNLNLRFTGIESIQGVQNLTELRELNITSTQVSDLSPLSEGDFSTAYGMDGLWLGVGATPCEDFTPLSGLERLEGLDMNSVASDLWASAVENVHIRQLHASGCFDDTDDLTAILTDHPELEQLHIPWNEHVTDLTPLLGMENLRYVKVSVTMEEAIASLGGEYGFELEIEG